jgi:hypothetical protein
MRLIIFICFGFFMNKLYAQNSDLGSWNILNVRLVHTKKLSYFAEGQIRSLKFYDNFHYYEIKGGVNFKVNEGFQLTLASGSYQTYKEGGNFVTPKNNNEFRVWPQIQLSQNLGKFKVEQRYRAELRFTSNGYRNRFRYRLLLSRPFGAVRNEVVPFNVSVSNELFFTDNEPYFERNRLAFNFTYRHSKQVSFMLGYLHQFDYKINDETGRDFLQIGCYFDLKLKQKD